ncbi:MAG TPA: NfeD family protein [Candidatus Binatia bacterium]|nr:NfeD family protein [Candidatus Binatia bacterium]
MDAFFIYFICFGVGLVFTVLSAFLGHVFGGTDAHADVGTGGHAEAGFEHTGMPGVSPFSPTTVASFITAFGGFGMIFSKIELTRPWWISAPLAAFMGLAIAAGVFLMFNAIFSRTQSSSESRVGALVGASATVITPIPQHGVGEIAYVQGGSRYTAPARSESGAAIVGGQTVKINRVVGTQFYVVPI